jgi:hypothetical protein
VKVFVKFSERHPEPTVANIHSKKIVLVGIALWVLVLIILLAFYPALSDAGLLWWLHTALVGIGLGVLGFFAVRKS